VWRPGDWQNIMAPERAVVRVTSALQL